VIDEQALAASLDRRQIAAAALDSYTHEPTVPSGLLAHETITLAPHLGSATLTTRQAKGRLAADNILAVLAGRPALTPACA